MDPIAAERLKKLQMEDLGTARREHISTSDSKRFQKVCLEDLEATRRSNKAGSEAQQAAEVNRSRLSGWANVYKELSDTQDLEDLENILGGQSHRAQLSALIHNHGGQSYTKTVNKRDNFLKVAEMDHGRGHGPSRRSLHPGRGGGIVGTRGRQLAPVPSSASARTSNQGAISKLGRYTVEAPPGRTRLDPALDSNNDPSEATPRPNFKTRGKMPERTPLRTRRPIVGDYARILSPPESFLAIARGMVNSKNSGDDTSSQGPKKPGESPMESEKATKECHTVSEKSTDKSPRPSTEKPVASKPPSRAISTPGATKKLPTKAANTPPRPSTEKTVDSRASSGGIPAPKFTNKDRASPGKAAGTVPHQSTVKHTASLPPRGPKASLTPKPSAPSPLVPGKNDTIVCTPAANQFAKKGDRVSQKSSTSGATTGQGATADSRATEHSTKSLPSSKELTIPKTETETVSTSAKDTEDLLLDLSSTPPERSPLGDGDFMNSPACQDLRGIDFRHSSDAISSQEAETTPASSGSKQPSSKTGDATLSTSSSNDAVTLADYQRQLALLSAVLEGTTLSVLGDEYCQKLKDCKQELEAKIKEARQGPPESSSQLQKTPELSNSVPETTLKEAETPAQNTPSEQGKKTDASPLEDSASSLRLKQAVHAPVFFPRSSSFCGYRSPKNSISSNSTSPPPTPVPTRSAAIPIRAPPPPAPVNPEPPTSHIFGDHLLPGRRSRVASQKSISSISGTSTDEPSASKVSFSLPKQRPVIVDAQLPAFESDNTKTSTQPMASNDVPLPLETESISHVGSPTGSSASKKANPELTTSQPTAQTTNDTQKTGSTPSSLGQSIHAAKPPTQTGSSTSLPQKTETVTPASSTARLGINTAPPKSASPTVFQKEAQGTESKPSSLRQSIHAAPIQAPAKQPTTGDPKIVQKVDPNLDSSKRSIFASSSKPQPRSFSGSLTGIMSSRYAMPENHKPTR